MKITKIEALCLRVKCAPIHDALSTSDARQAVLVKISTDTEHIGIGEAFTYGAPLPVMKYLVEELLGPMLIDADPEQIDELWKRIYWRTIAQGRRSHIMGAISGIDIALWDLKGKATGKSIAQLLGQKLDRIPSYASGGFYAPGKDLDGLKAELESYRKKGYNHAKIKIGRNLDRPGPLRYKAAPQDTVTVEEDWRRMEAARSLLEPNSILIVDTNASWTADQMLENADRLRSVGVNWIEEPIPFEDIDGYHRLAREMPDICVLGCETEQGLSGFERLAKQGEISIVQPDVGWAGGISEVLRIGAMAKELERHISLHCFGSAVLFAASLQVAAAMENTIMMESEENPNPLRDELTTSPFAADPTMSFFVPNGPGLGIELDESALVRYCV